jgi:hypothetical protein
MNTPDYLPIGPTRSRITQVIAISFVVLSSGVALAQSRTPDEEPMINPMKS